MILLISILWPLSIALTGMLCHYHGRKHRDSQWCWAVLWREDSTKAYCHEITNQLPTKP